MSTAAERRGLDLSSAPKDVQAALNRIMWLEDENDRLRKALARLVALKDGPRDADYKRCKPLAWDQARAALTHPTGEKDA